MQELDDALTEDSLWALVKSKEAVAQSFVDDRANCREAWIAAGFAVELALKAVIIRQRRYNQWPSREAAPELHTHSLRMLVRHAGIDLTAIPLSVRASLRTTLDWTRGHDYMYARMSRAQARSMVDAAFGEGGVVQWLKTLS